MSFSSVPVIIQALSNTQAGIPTNAGALGVSPADLNELLTECRNPNLHTRPLPSLPKKVDPVSPYNNAHLDVFLRCYQRAGVDAQIPDSVFHKCLDFCTGGNDCTFVTKIQCQAAKSFVRAIEGKNFNTPALPSSSKSDDPPMTLGHIKLNFPKDLRKCTAPHFTVTTPLHFSFVVDTQGGAGAKYFSSQVGIKNESGSTLSIKILHRTCLVDGVVRKQQQQQPSSSSVVGPAATAAANQQKQPQQDTDFQVFMDKNSIPKKGAATLLLSLIAQPTAVFSHVHEVVVLTINDVVPLIVTFSVLNPSLPLFGTPFPGALMMPINCRSGGTSGGGTKDVMPYQAPVVLELLRTIFVSQGGLQLSKNSVAHVLDSAMFQSNNRAAISEAVDVRSVIEDLGLVDVVASSIMKIPSSNGVGEKEDFTTGGAASSMGGGGAEGEDKDAEEGRECIPPNTTLEQLLPGSDAVSFKVPVAVAGVTPPATLQLILMWLAECPTPLVDSSILSCDSQVYLETLTPSVQGVMCWCIDFAIALLLSSRRVATEHHRNQAAGYEDEMVAASSSTGGGSRKGGTNSATLTAVGGSTSVRVLALMFAVAISETFRPGCEVGGSKDPNVQSPVGERAGVSSNGGKPATSMSDKLHVQQYLTTAFVHWICRYMTHS